MKILNEIKRYFEKRIIPRQTFVSYDDAYKFPTRKVKLSILYETWKDLPGNDTRTEYSQKNENSRLDFQIAAGKSGGNPDMMGLVMRLAAGRVKEGLHPFG